MFHIQSKMIFIKNKEWHIITLSFPWEQETKKNPSIYVSYWKRQKIEGKCYKKRERKRTSIPTLLRFPAYKKSQYEQSEMIDMS